MKDLGYKRQLNRCKQKVMELLGERKLSLARKKTHIGLVSQGFHFLGVNYLGTQPQDHTRNACASDYCSNKKHTGWVELHLPNIPTPNQTTPHPRTLRKARETVKLMVTHGFAATQEIKNYLSRWCFWWANTNTQWSYQQLLIEFMQTTHQAGLRILATTLFDEQFGRSRIINWADNTFLAQVSL